MPKDKPLEVVFKVRFEIPLLELIKLWFVPAYLRAAIKEYLFGFKLLVPEAMVDYIATGPIRKGELVSLDQNGQVSSVNPYDPPNES